MTKVLNFSLLWAIVLLLFSVAPLGCRSSGDADDEEEAGAATIPGGIEHSDDDDDASPPDYEDKMLERFADCEELLLWLQDAAIMEMERYLMECYVWEPGDDDIVSDDDAGGDDANYTETNVQEEGVDEPDLVKTDGETLLLSTGGYLLLYDAVDQTQTAELARVDIEGRIYGMFIHEGTALVLSRVVNTELSDNVWPGVDHENLYGWITKITLIDYRERTNPVVAREYYLEGYFIDGRRVDNAAYVVSQLDKMQARLDLHIYSGDYDSEADFLAAIEELIEKNTTIIRETTIDDWLPTYFSVIPTGGAPLTETGWLTACGDHYRPDRLLGSDILTVSTFLLDEPAGRMPHVSLVAEGWNIYASGANLYVSGRYRTYEYLGYFDDVNDMAVCPLHRFAIEDSGPAVYKGSVGLPGWPNDQFNMSEYDGYLRVVTAAGGAAAIQQNGLYVYQLVEDGLLAVGSLEGLAPGETIYAVRMMGPRGYVVTYLEVDPLFTIDLSDPYHPQLVGELEVPGFSTYLHPLGGDYLLAIGRGEDWTLVASMFDLTDFADPQRLYQYDFGDASSDAQYDHHAFLYDSSCDLLVLPMSGYLDFDEDFRLEDLEADGSGGDRGESKAGDDDDDDDDHANDEYFTGMVILNATPENGFQYLTAIDHRWMEPEPGGDPWMEGVPIPQRSVRIGDYLYTISDVALIVTDISTWLNVAEIGLPFEW